MEIPSLIRLEVVITITIVKVLINQVPIPIVRQVLKAMSVRQHLEETVMWNTVMQNHLNLVKWKASLDLLIIREGDLMVEAEAPAVEVVEEVHVDLGNI